VGENLIGSFPYGAVLKEYWFFLVLLFLAIASFLWANVALLPAFVFTFLVPGLILSRFFRLEFNEFLAIVPVLSVLVSTQLVYYLSYLFGYSKITVLTSFLALSLVYAFVISRKRKVSTFSFRDFLKITRRNKTLLSVFFLIFVIALVVLARSVWLENQYGIVITGSNWQDTPYHYEIIESINNGNFPPQMPYFSGDKLTYQGDYFVDLHTSIIEKVYGFLPQLLPFLNAVFIFIFALSVYSLARAHGKRAAIVSTVIATFGWGFSYFGLFSALSGGHFSFFQNYGYQYNGFFGLPPVFDNLLQQRPLLVGLPVFALVLLLLRDMRNKNRILLAGVITGLVFPFHVVSFFCAYAAYFLSILLNLRNFKRHYLYFLVSAAFVLPFLVSGSPSVPISLAPLWAANFLKGNPVLYYVANLGIPFVAALVSFAYPTKIKENLLKVVFITLFLIPNIISLTPNPWDMYKFFIFAWVPIAVLSGAILARLSQKSLRPHFSLFRKGLALLLILLSLLASVSVILYNVGTNYIAVNKDEYNLGLWVRENTPEGSVFLAYYYIHCPPTMIGGRIRVLSYINWPYGHGVPLDDIWTRMHDVDRAYNGTETDLKQVVETYKINYIYVGGEELRNYPGCIAKFNAINWLKPVYNDSLSMYEVLNPQNDT
jgi:hypothetical protein